jgi:DNA polymerase/3'-5' exonuclease PolX
MSKSDVRLPLVTASRLADEVAELLRPYCERLEIAGSIRREREDIGDIDIVCIPRFRTEVPTAAPTDLFGELVDPKAAEPVQISLLDERCAELLELGMFALFFDTNGRKSWGSDLKKGYYKGLRLDICSATAETWAYWYTIRTGPWEFSKRLVTERRHGGFCPQNLHFKGGRLRQRDNEEPLDTPDEESLFAALGIAYLLPIVRSATVEPRRVDLEPARG